MIKKWLWGLLATVTLIAAPAARANDPPGVDFVPVQALALQSEAVVAKTLGKPDECEKIKYGRRCRYKQGSVEVVYIGGQADWITVYPPPKSVLFSSSALSTLGLPSGVKPSFSNEHVMRWQGLAGFVEVQANPVGGHVWYWYIKARTS